MSRQRHGRTPCHDHDGEDNDDDDAVDDAVDDDNDECFVGDDGAEGNAVHHTFYVTKCFYHSSYSYFCVNAKNTAFMNPFSSTARRNLLSAMRQKLGKNT